MRAFLLLTALTTATLLSAAARRSPATPLSTANRTSTATPHSAANPASPSPRLTIDSQKVVGKELIVVVANLSDVPATAYMIGASETEFLSVDALLGARDGRPLAPGATAELRVPTARADATARVMAAVFEDGSKEGDARSVLHVLAARRDVYAELPQALALLRHAATQNVTSSTAAYWFRQWQQRWRAGDPTRSLPVPLAAEMFLAQMGQQPAEGPARELIQVFEQLSAKLAQSKSAF